MVLVAIGSQTVREAVPCTQTGNGESHAAIRVKVGAVVCAVDFAQQNGDVSGWTMGHVDWRGTLDSMRLVFL